MIADWTGEFQHWLDTLDAKADEGDPIARRQVEYADAGIAVLTDLPEPPGEDTAVLKRVRQRGKYPIWRVSHPFDDEVAVRLIAWFPERQTAGVIVAFGGDKKKIGDAFYASAASRADAAIDQWLRERTRES
ncbi:hypothetical protein O982_23770 [Mycobacterium avium 10-5581]|nr:hypothetical protein O982_23770 [Mycobacterium avium 10-5581]